MGGKALGPVMIPQYRGMPGLGSKSGWVCEQGEGGWDRSFLEGDNSRNVNKENI